jgi:hypothetical protein
MRVPTDWPNLALDHYSYFYYLFGGNKMIDLSEHFIRFAVEQNLVMQALAGCEVALLNCERDDIAEGREPLDGWAREEIRTRFHRHSFVFERDPQHPVYIETVIELYVQEPTHRDGSEFKWPIGSYGLITLINGEAFSKTKCNTFCCKVPPWRKSTNI